MNQMHFIKRAKRLTIVIAVPKSSKLKWISPAKISNTKGPVCSLCSQNTCPFYYNFKKGISFKIGICF